MLFYKRWLLFSVPLLCFLLLAADLHNMISWCGGVAVTGLKGFSNKDDVIRVILVEENQNISRIQLEGKHNVHHLTAVY